MLPGDGHGHAERRYRDARFRSIATLANCSQPLLNFLHSLSEDLAPHHKVVLVAHSMGGLTLSLAMEKYSHKIALAIFVAAVVTPSGKALPDTPLHDADIVIASHLIRWFHLTVPGTSVTYTKQKHGQVPSVCIKHRKHQMLLPQAQDYIIESHGPISEIVEIENGHFNFWPTLENFTMLILGLADKYVNLNQKLQP